MRADGGKPYNCKELGFICRSLNGTMIAQRAVEIKSRAISITLARRMVERLLPEYPVIGARGHRLQPKVQTDSAAQGTFILGAHQRLDPFATGIQEHERRIANVMAAGERTSLGRIQVRQDKRHLPVKLRSERVDDALEFGTVRSAR
jgi:hypothetical protein